MPVKSMIHLNGNLLCSIDVETTGLQAGHHELLQVCFLPLDNNLEPRQDLPIYDVKIKPQYPGRIDAKAMSVNKVQLGDIQREGFDSEVAFDLFEHWFERLNLPERKRISPLAQNWPFDRGFLIEWMGWENFNHRIDGRGRDTQSTALFLNDRSDFQGEQTPFAAGVGLTKLANTLSIDVIQEATHDALYDCMLTSQVYRAMCKEYVE